MLSAATMTMRPIVIEIGHLLEPQRLEQRAVHRRPVLRDVAVAEDLRDGGRDLRRGVDVVERQLDQLRLASCSSAACATSSETNPKVLSTS